MNQVEETIKPIPEEFRKNGLRFKILKRNTNAVLYEISIWLETCRKRVVGFEVHKIRVGQTHPKDTSPYALTERLASNEEFGRYAWGYQYLVHAMEKYNEKSRSSKDESRIRLNSLGGDIHGN